MEDFFNWHQNPTFTAGDANTNFRVNVVTNLANFTTSAGQFRADQLKASGCQTSFEGENCTLTVLKEAGESGLTVQNLEEIAIAFVPSARTAKVGAIDVSVDQELTAAQWGQLYYNACLVNYEYVAKGVAENRPNFITSINLVGATAETLAHEDFVFYSIMANSKTHCRDLANGRVNIINTHSLQDIVGGWAAKHESVSMTQLYDQEVKDEGLMLHYSVGMGSKYKPLFINLKYNGNPDSEEYHGLVGKGVIFDVGGTNVKQGPLMFWMFLDKGGACAVYSAFKGIVEAGLKVNVTCSIPFAENSVDGEGYRTSDIIKSHYGPTVEIVNTDAEGRLLLADAMSWTQKNYKLNSMIELSTLTGASLVALGHEHACVMSNHDCIVNEISEAGNVIREKVWRLPLVDYVRKRLKNSPADLANHVYARDAGTIQAGCFLENFVDEGVRWIHVDIAAAMINLSGNLGPYKTKGATGFGVGFLMEHFRNLHRKNTAA